MSLNKGNKSLNHTDIALFLSPNRKSTALPGGFFLCYWALVITFYAKERFCNEKHGGFWRVDIDRITQFTVMKKHVY